MPVNRSLSCDLLSYHSSDSVTGALGKLVKKVRQLPSRRSLIGLSFPCQKPRLGLRGRSPQTVALFFLYDGRRIVVIQIYMFHSEEESAWHIDLLVCGVPLQ